MRVVTNPRAEYVFETDAGTTLTFTDQEAANWLDRIEKERGVFFRERSALLVAIGAVELAWRAGDFAGVRRALDRAIEAKRKVERADEERKARREVAA